MYTDERKHLRTMLLGILLSVAFWLGINPKSYATVGLVTMQLELEATPGATCTGQLAVSNSSDTVEHVQIRIVAPEAFHLLNRLPAILLLQPHSVLKLPLKFMISRNWTDSEATVLVDAFNEKTAVVESSTRFVVRQRERTERQLLKFSLANESPFVHTNQDTLVLDLRLQNLGFHSRALKLIMHSLPDGFRLAPTQSTTITVASRQDTLLKIPCLAWSLRKEHSYQIAIELQDVTTKQMLGVVICRPVLLASTKRFRTDNLADQNQGFGIMVGYGSLGQSGAMQELSAWGRQAVGKGMLSFNTHFLSYSANNYRELRDTYLDYEQDKWQVRLGSIYDYHELLLNGTGIKAAYTVGETHIEAWALTNTTNWLRSMPGQGGSRTYSLRVSGQVPVTANMSYVLSSSYYSLQRSDRSGLLHFGKLDWQLSPQSRLKVTLGNSTEAGFSAANRNQTVGWAAGGDYTYTSPKVDVGVRTFFSNPDYSGLQRGASQVEHTLFYKALTNTTLTYRFSRIAYDQRIYTSENTGVRHSFNSTIFELSASRKIKNFSLTLRPYYWYQSQAGLFLNAQQSQSYRLTTLLRYMGETGGYAELGLDAGLYKSASFAPSGFEVPVYRINAMAGIGTLNLFLAYQHGPYQINDQQTMRVNPKDLRQFIISPTYQYTLLDKKLRGDIGLNANFSTQSSVWSGFLHHSIAYNVTESLQLRGDISINSYANDIDELAVVRWQNTQMRMSMTKTFSSLSKKASHNLSLRFYEDLNGNRQKDADDPWLEGLVVNVNDQALITNKKGTIVCKGLATGLTIVRTQCKIVSGEAILLTDSVRLVKSMQRDIPIRKTSVVSGQLICNLAKYGDKACDLNSFQVEATNNLNETYRTYADERGMFKLFLPPGQFTIRVVNSLDPAMFMANPVTYTVDLSDKGGPSKLQINVEGSNRTIKVKRFTL
jgi:hypothetical protein